MTSSVGSAVGCTKSGSDLTGVAVSTVAESSGGGACVVSAGRSVLMGFFVVRHAGASTITTITRLVSRAFHIFVIAGSTPFAMISENQLAVGSWQFAADSCQLQTANCEPRKRRTSSFRFLRPVGLFVF